ncbi:unnamed protein product [Pleuronectes platessa]|uniref:Uncharacterized protein n=1 Tax=Pleuronectes platessa TaxID=8262 RepID=A0A9N7VEF7_PLEPL|nr:unnamed protein product [Pleuronectes platessa]
MRISATSCICPFLVCLCFIQRCYGASPRVPSRVPSRNQTRLANGETEVHHRPKRGWIWNQFFVLEEHMGPKAQYVGKLRSLSARRPLREAEWMKTEKVTVTVQRDFSVSSTRSHRELVKSSACRLPALIS